jgi:carbonic anhydrase
MINMRRLNIYRKRNFKFDLLAGIVVFLIATPFCLSLALASKTPLLSGLISGIIGGIVVSIIGSSQTNVSGPAVGMVTVILSMISYLGNFNTFLLSLSIAGVIQVIIGSLRAGFIADYISTNILRGLLCAIGILLIIKQLPLTFTLSHTVAAFADQLIDLSNGISFSQLHDLSFHINSGALLLSLGSLAILIYMDSNKKIWTKNIPGAFVVIVFAIVANELFMLCNSYLMQNEPHLVNLPKIHNLKELYYNLEKPDFTALNNHKVYIVALIIAILSSIDNLLNIQAGERIDNKKRLTSKNREIVAQGIGNMLAGLFGGLPIASFVIRTSVNIQTGAKTKISSIIHGLLLLLTIIIAPNALNKIPLSALAAIIIYNGYKLTKPKIYREIYSHGADRFVPFVATIIGVLFFNMLCGVLFGIIVNIFYVLRTNSQVRLNIIKEVYPTGVTHRLVLPQQATFLNKAALIAELDSLPKNSQLIIDARYTDYIDKEIVEFIKEFKEDLALVRKISINLIGFKDEYRIHNYIDFITVTTFDVQSNLSPRKILNILYEGNQRFIHDNCINRSIQTDLKFTAETQHPIAVVLGCIDSRVPVESVFDMSIGDLFCVRIAGNVINNDVLASIEYACNVVGAKLIVVLGHTKCGAICAACDNVEQGNITELLAKIKPAIAAEKSVITDRTAKNRNFVDKVTTLNIALTIERIYDESSTLQNLISSDAIGIVGALYDVTTGIVNFHNAAPNLEAFTKKNRGQLKEKLTKLIEE